MCVIHVHMWNKVNVYNMRWHPIWRSHPSVTNPEESPNSITPQTPLSFFTSRYVAAEF